MAGQPQEAKPKGDPHAWRRKPRKFAPKSRLGCKTCKYVPSFVAIPDLKSSNILIGSNCRTRRIKCDLSQPSCFRCSSTGRPCDGYGNQLLPTCHESYADLFPSASKGDQVPVAQSKKLELRLEPKLESKHQALSHQVDHLNLRRLAPLLVRPATEPAQGHTMKFFEHVSIRQLTEYHYSESWCKALMYFSQTVASVRYAAIALASVQRCQDDSPSGHGPLVYYNLAIRHLLNRQTDGGPESTAITLLVCYLLICFDHVVGNDAQAIQHLRGGVALLRSLEEGAAAKKKKIGTCQRTGTEELLSQITRQIHRLDLQAVIYLLPWVFLDAAEMPALATAGGNGAFRSLDHAIDSLLVLIARVMRLCNDEIESPESTCPGGTRRHALRGQLAGWLTRFDAMLARRGASRETEVRDQHFINLSYLQHCTITIMLSAFGPNRELMFDDFLPDFQRCLSLATKVVSGQERASLSPKGKFTPELGVIPVLYIIGWKCRHPVVRREALGLLRKLHLQEATWDSVTTAKIVERTIEIEEGNFWKAGRLPEMSQISLPQRIGLFYWERTFSGIDLTYMFCGGDESFTEALTVTEAERLVAIKYRE